MKNHTTHIGAVQKCFVVGFVTVLANLSFGPSVASPFPPISASLLKHQFQTNTLQNISCTKDQIQSCNSEGIIQLACPSYDYDTIVELKKCRTRMIAKCLRDCGGITQGN
jgi:hypothetical protein